MKRFFMFSNKWLIGYLTFISAFAPLSTDMYLPALPHMVTSLATDYAKASLSVSGFLLIFALSMLIWGPLSDKYGRRPVLLGGSLVYVFASVAIALASSIVPLLCWRALQALGSGAVSAMALAIVKDMLRGQALEQVVAWMQTVMVLAPILAPVLGGWILLAVDWRGIFWMLAFCGLLSFLGALGFRETCLPAHRNRGSVFSALGRLFVVLGHPEFRWPLLLFSAMNMPFMAYLAVSSYVFQTLFGLSPQHYSLFFAGNAVMGMLGPLAHMRFFPALAAAADDCRASGPVRGLRHSALPVRRRRSSRFCSALRPHHLLRLGPAAAGNGADDGERAGRQRRGDLAHQRWRPALRQPVHVPLRPALLERSGVCGGQRDCPDLRPVPAGLDGDAAAGHCQKKASGGPACTRRRSKASGLDEMKAGALRP